MGKLTVEESSLVGIADIIRDKTNKKSTEKIAFPEEFKSLLNGITPAKNGVSPTTITSTGEHETGGYEKVFVDSSILNGYVAEQYGLTRAGRRTFNVTSANDTSSEDSPLLWVVPDFAPKLIIFGPTANSNAEIGYSSSKHTTVMSFWIDSEYFPLGTSNLAGRKKGLYISKSNKINVSNNNLGFEYSKSTGKIFLKQSSGWRVAPMQTTSGDGYYEILYWGV